MAKKVWVEPNGRVSVSEEMPEGGAKEMPGYDAEEMEKNLAMLGEK
jgi:hypothetical protein